MLTPSYSYMVVFAAVLLSFSAGAQTPTDTSGKSLDPVVITGQHAPQTVRSSVYKVRVIDNERIRQRAAVDVFTVLNNEAGIRFNIDPALGETDIALMGLSGQNVKVLLDGIPLVDRGGTRQSLSQIDINSVDRIEIVEGPMSVVYGTDALAGVINIITKKGKSSTEHFNIVARIQEESVGNSYSPFAQEGVHHQNLSASFSKGNWNAGTTVTRNNHGGFAGGFAAPAKAWKPKDQALFGGHLGFRSGGFDVAYRIDFAKENIFAAGPVNTANFRGFDQYFFTDRFTHQLQTNWHFKPSLRWTSAVSFQNYRRATESFIVDYSAQTKTPTDPSLPANAGHWDVNTFKTAFLRSTLQWTASDKLSLQPGIEIKNDQTTGGRIKGNPVITDYSLFLSAEYKPNTSIALRPGLRFSKNSVFEAPPIIPSMNAKWKLNKNFDLRLSYARGFRSPILRELYFNFFDANHQIEGNEELKAEYSNSYQASLGWTSNASSYQFSASVSGFYNDIRNRIGLAFRPGTTVSTYLNIARFRTTGATAEINFSLKQLKIVLNAALVGQYNQLSDDQAFEEKNLPPFTWSPDLGTNLSYRFTKLGDLQVGLFYKFTGRLPIYEERTNPNTNSSEAVLVQREAFHWADFTATKPIGNNLTVQTGIRNLFNITRVENGIGGGGAHGTSGPQLTGYGRSLFLGLTFNFSKTTNN